VLCRQDGRCAERHNDVEPPSDQFRGQLAHAREIALGEVNVEADIAPFDIAELVEPLPGNGRHRAPIWLSGINTPTVGTLPCCARVA
jgi:hypothetical protein